MPVLFAVTLFVSAGLLFMVQPMVGRMVLPLLGGSPAAWNTCMVFFQAMLLLGYLYAHKLTNRLQPRNQVIMHLGVLGAAIATFAISAFLSSNSSPIAVVKSLAPQNTAYPMFGVLVLLFLAVGVPFFAVSTSAPLLQRWFAYSGHRAAKDPYFLYAASNAGSLISLLGYPIITEPNLRLVEQAWVWAFGFVLLAVLILLCGRTIAPAATDPQASTKTTTGKPQVVSTTAVPPPPTLRQKLHWLLLAFVPSSLMLGVTTYMTTDIASVPLLWVIPLAMYLLTFIIAYARTPDWFRPVLGNLTPVITLLLVFVIASQHSLGSVFFTLGLHLLAYFFLALLMHTELAYHRPAPVYLTGYFLWISVGGMLGGVFNALVAPIVFPLGYEYPIAIAIGCMLIPKLFGDAEAEKGSIARSDEPKKGRAAMSYILDGFIPLVMLAVMGGLTLLPDLDWFGQACTWASQGITKSMNRVGINGTIYEDHIMMFIVFAVPAMACFFFIDRPVRFGLCVAAILFVSIMRQTDAYVVKTDRSFFGILKVEKYSIFNRLLHGTTLHGTQITDPWPFPDELKESYPAVLSTAAVYSVDYRQEPLTYYHRTGPVGHMIDAMRAKDKLAPFGMVGLGTGSVSCYALPGQTLTFYEIDPSVKRLVADDDQYFTYVRDARDRGATVDIVMGDARIKLEEERDRKFDLLFVDAFSSDAIPVHLLTREAVALYMERVTEHGLVGLHISNKFVQLEPVVAAIAADLGLEARVFRDFNERPTGKTISSWVVLARKTEDMQALLDRRLEDGEEPAWVPLKPDPAVVAWTDDYSDVLSVMMIKEIQKIRRFFGQPVVQELVD